MASTSNRPEPAQERAPDPLSNAYVYRLRRDTMMIVSNLNRGMALQNMEALKKQMVFVQGQLCKAALADPRISQRVKDVLMRFQQMTVLEDIEDRRGSRQRAQRASAGERAGDATGRGRDARS